MEVEGGGRGEQGGLVTVTVSLIFRFLFHEAHLGASPSLIDAPFGYLSDLILSTPLLLLVLLLIPLPSPSPPPSCICICISKADLAPPVTLGLQCTFPSWSQTRRKTHSVQDKALDVNSSKAEGDGERGGRTSSRTRRMREPRWRITSGGKSKAIWGVGQERR